MVPPLAFALIVTLVCFDRPLEVTHGRDASSYRLDTKGIDNWQLFSFFNDSNNLDAVFAHGKSRSEIMFLRIAR